MQTINLTEIRNDHKKVPQFTACGKLEAVISKSFYSKRKFSVGVNHWTKGEISHGSRIINGIHQIFVSLLYV